MVSASFYNLYLPFGRGGFDWVVANTASGAILLADGELKRLLEVSDPKRFETLKEQAPDVHRYLVSRGMLVEDGLDELGRIRIWFQRTKFGYQHMNLTVLPTVGCNLGCIYCYETPSPGVMSPEVADRLTSFVEAHVPPLESLRVVWYGGEPLIGAKALERVSRKLIDLCDEHGIDYHAAIVTNGTLLSEKIVDLLLRCRVGHAQITLDGPAEVHDSRRPFRRTGGGTFERILKGLERLKGRIPASIRINVDRSNVDRYRELVDLLAGRGLLGVESGNTVALGLVKDWTDEVGVAREQLLSLVEFEHHLAELQQALAGEGLQEGGLAEADFRPSPPCAAVNVLNYVVLPDGSLRKCWIHATLPDTEVGDLETGLDLSRPAAVEWTAFDPTRDPECAACRLLPVCAGGCPYERLTGREEKEIHCEYR
ncbi:MAG: radical SAM protein, partial [Acidobacteria bacterium]|nr:radical SAM protein [Acidobacteriota bacterium]